MKRKEFYQIVSPLTEKLYALAYTLLPDDLQAEQLVIDAINAYLFKEKKWINNKEIDLTDHKEVGLVRKSVFKALIRNLQQTGIRRSMQLNELTHFNPPGTHQLFFSLEPKARFILRLRYENNFSVDEIGDIFQIPRYEVIEKLHNGRFLLMHNLNPGESV
jgi:hypothetical protein